jgi:hypothetical protein
MYLLKEESDGSFQAISIGDKILAGKFKNKRCTIIGFEFDEKNQPRIITDKGKFNMYSFRIERLLPKE